MTKKRQRRYRDVSDFLAMTRRVVRAAARRMAAADVEDLQLLVDLQAEIDGAMLEAIRGLRASGVTWESIGAVTGTSRQAALMRWSPKLQG